MQASKFELELLAIRTLCAGKEAGLALLNHVTPQHFHNPTTSLMYRRLMARLKNEGHVPDWNDLLNDSTIPEEKRQHAQRIVKKKNLKPSVSQRKGEALFVSLDNFRKLRAFYETLNKAGNSLNQPAFDIDELINQTRRDLIAIDVNHRGAPVTVDGVMREHVVEAMTNAESLIPTGFTEFDDRTGGIPESAVFLMGADTGGFKSVTSLQMAANIAKGKKPAGPGLPTNQRRVGFYSLEMTLSQIVRRQTANVANVDMNSEMMLFAEMRRKAKSLKELEDINNTVRQRAEKVAEIFAKDSESWTKFLHFTCPAEEVDINWILQQAEMSDREVIIIDYVGLLAGLSGDDQWRAMSNVVRQAKIWTNRTGKTVIILAQMRFENGKPELKYSKAILDHCNNAWAWQHIKVNGRDYLIVTQMKARESMKYLFGLRVWPEFSRVGDPVDAADEEVIRNALEDIKNGKDPEKRYQKTPTGEKDAERRDLEFEEDEPLLKNGGLAGGVKSYDTSADDDVDQPFSRNDARGRKPRVTAREILGDTKTRAIALSKLNRKVSHLTLEEAAIQADEIIQRWEEAAAGHRIGIEQLTKEALGLTNTRAMLHEIKRLQGDKAAQKRLSPSELEIHRQRVDILRQATQAIKTKGREYVSEEDFYAKNDLQLAVDRGEEPLANPRTLDQPWELNAVAWADQPAITLPNSAKPIKYRWGNGKEPDALVNFKRQAKAPHKEGKVIKGQRAILWPPRRGKVEDYHYLDDVQLDSVVNIATKYVSRSLDDVSLGEFASDIGKYVELMGPGASRIHNRKRKRVVLDDAAYKKACKKFGLTYG
jgi:replicative DNA helicase